MIFPKEIDNMILETIIKHGSLTFQELQAWLCNRASQPNLYKKVQEFIKKHILVKDWKTITLNKKWIMAYLNLAKKMQDTYLNTNNISIDLVEGEHRKYTANSLFELDAIWASLLAELNLLYNYKEKNYVYNAHTYHVIGMPNADIILFENIWDRVPETLFLVWNNTVIDQHGTSLLSWIQNTQLLIDEKVELLKAWYFLNIVWEYYIEVLLPDILNEYFELIFKNTIDINTLNVEVFKQLFYMKIPVWLTLYRNIAQSSQFAKQIELSFKKHKWASLWLQ